MAGVIQRRVEARHAPPVSTVAEISARMEVIKQIATPLGEKYDKWIPRSDESLSYWTVYETSGFQTLPYTGGMVDQPTWIKDDFYGFMELTEYNELIQEYKALERKLVKELSNQ